MKRLYFTSLHFTSTKFKQNLGKSSILELFETEKYAVITLLRNVFILGPFTRCNCSRDLRCNFCRAHSATSKCACIPPVTSGKFQRGVTAIYMKRGGFEQQRWLQGMRTRFV